MGGGGGKIFYVTTEEFGPVFVGELLFQLCQIGGFSKTNSLSQATPPHFNHSRVWTLTWKLKQNKTKQKNLRSGF